MGDFQLWSICQTGEGVATGAEPWGSAAAGLADTFLDGLKGGRRQEFKLSDSSLAWSLTGAWPPWPGLDRGVG
jgi:hypothetical protein